MRSATEPYIGDPMMPLYPELTRHLTVAFGQEVTDLLTMGASIVVFNARETGYIDSYGLGVIVRCAKQCRDAGAKFIIVGLNEDLRTLFALLKLDVVVTTYTQAEYDVAIQAGAL